MDNFFSNLDIYDQLKQPKKRAALMIGPPGCSKSTSIKLTLDKLEDDKTVVIFWPTGGVESEAVSDFFKSRSE